MKRALLCALLLATTSLASAGVIVESPMHGVRPVRQNLIRQLLAGRVWLGHHAHGAPPDLHLDIGASVHLDLWLGGPLVLYASDGR